ncbi:hypothetical protein A3C20_01500 [Candidatus Kaiserbacteria bacterium RIFCSPHIGHO2_02_FULL_55_25]|uniref:Uncharacterized protein n=1 Tax=Candidatus Kaiserbacteria bacterium RIFCSPHIGHO2_02_FULL_55_25 TaxID=1798498 RepID=A0A1F6E5N1_9BACT|nr:MAG: hypothetical protein A2764_00735 [Candidatus Kaiserbacteria bacterium RIFCSPHIGHO2_01_FULL_55_79]OGG68999.1 MAG: hypothetical protein A3C20_01500 [Candidatus Kaiserbacteria bacterium RIFCSPHIGHO2_02_FULL_55_25]OGG77351.1 MAG: hypothetical protein A3F56_03925 [Candidatus Kaiserbacteria bacterium RIFCSPHIGHO2_12_FULL_55_13]OGG82615.1 MAG: hypothetical protein A3A42_00750 [Candidatus Kaiserbacteria bacterium RIFCSPLOWO2_01_FULL_55_25]
MIDAHDVQPRIEVLRHAFEGMRGNMPLARKQTYDNAVRRLEEIQGLADAGHYVQALYDLRWVQGVSVGLGIREPNESD